MALHARLGVHNGTHEQLHREGKGLVRGEKKQVFQEECVLVPDLSPRIALQTILPIYTFPPSIETQSGKRTY